MLNQTMFTLDPITNRCDVTISIPNNLLLPYLNVISITISEPINVVLGDGHTELLVSQIGAPIEITVYSNICK